MMHALLSCVCESLLWLPSFRCGLRSLGQVLSTALLRKFRFCPKGRPSQAKASYALISPTLIFLRQTKVHLLSIPYEHLKYTYESLLWLPT